MFFCCITGVHLMNVPLNLFAGMPVGKQVMHLRTFIYSTVAVMQRGASVQMAENITKLLGIATLILRS